jgi:dethiobiotin synthetase
LTAELCKQKNIPVIGWIFNDQYLSYEHEIARWTGFPKLATVPFTEKIDGLFITRQADYIRDQLADFL